MERLLSELEKALQALLECEEIPNRPILEPRFPDCYEVLMENGYVYVTSVEGSNWIGFNHYVPTLLGRTYFDNLKREKSEHANAIWSDRFFQIRLSVFTILLSAAISVFVSRAYSEHEWSEIQNRYYSNCPAYNPADNPAATPSNVGVPIEE